MKKVKTFNEFINEELNESKMSVKVLGSIGDFQFFDDDNVKSGKVIILIVGSGMNQYEHPVEVNPQKDTPEKLKKRYYIGRQLRIEKKEDNI